MARIIWTPEVLRDLDLIGDYLLEVAPSKAAPQVERLIDAMEPVTLFPRMGRIVPEFRIESLRELIVDNFRIVYELDGETVWVVSIFHAAMDIESRLRDRGQSAL